MSCAVWDKPQQVHVHLSPPASGGFFDFLKYLSERSFYDIGPLERRTLIHPAKNPLRCQNYLEHAKEMGDGVPEEPVFFLKPNSALVPAGAAVPKPAWTNDLQHEVELAVRIGHQCSRVHVDKALAMVDGYAVSYNFV